MKSRAVRSVLALASLMLVANTILAQQYLVNQYSINEGLSQSTVTALYVDTRNRLWAGTCSGLNLLESSQFTHYDAKTKYGNIFSNNYIRSISEESENKIYVGSENGAYIVDGAGVKKIKHDWILQKDRMVRAYNVNGKIVVVTREGYVSVMNNLWKPVLNTKVENNEGTESFASKGNKVAIISRYPNKIIIINVESRKKEIIQGQFNKPNEELNTIEYSGEKLIASSNLGFYIIDGQNIKYKSWKSVGLNEPLNSNEVRFFKTDIHGNHWLGIFTKGVYVFDKNFNITHRLTGNYTNNSGLLFRLSNPTTIVFDKAMNAFIGTDGAGVIKVSLYTSKFKHLLPTEITKGKASENFTTAVFKEGDWIYFSVLNSALSLYNLKTGESSFHNSKNNKQQYINKIYFITRLNNKELLVSTDAGLFTFDLNNKLKYLAIPHSDIQFRNFDRLNDKTLILGAQTGVYIYNNNIIKKISTSYIDQISLIHVIDDKNFLTSEKGIGLFKITFSGKDTLIKMIPFGGLTGNLDPKFSNIEFDGKFYWAASSIGLFKFDEQLTHVQTITTQDGLVDNNLYCIEIDKTGKLWITSSKGLTVFNPKTRYIHNFSKEDGIQSFEYNSGAEHKTREGEIIFAGVGGINYFVPEEVNFNRIRPTISLSSIYLFDKEIDPQHHLDSIYEFSYLDNSLTFNFSVYENTVPEKNELEIYLEGLDKTWISLKNKRMIRYPFLPPGKYVLIARACNNDGVWTPKTKLATIIIRPPFYLQPWFIIFSIIILISLIFIIFYLVYLRKERQKIAELRTLQEIEKVRLRISKEIHDDIGSGLTQIAMISEQVQMEVDFDNDNTFVNNKLSKLRSISRELIQSMSEIVWFINPSNDSLENMLIYIRVMLNRIFEDSEIDLRLDFPMNVDKIDLNSETKRKIILMVKEAVNNAIKYSKASKMLVKITYDNNSLLFNIKDNGIGFVESKNILGNGLRNMKQSAEEIGFGYQLQSLPGEGTTIIFGGKLGGR